MLEAANIAAPADMEGENLVLVLAGQEESWNREAVYYHYYEYPVVQMMKRYYRIITEEYKLVHFYHDADEWELYDRLKDPQESNKVYAHPDYANIVAELKKDLAGLRKHYKDSAALDQKYVEMYQR